MLTESQLAQFEKDGYLVLENFFDPSKIRAEAEFLIEQVAKCSDPSGIEVFPYLSTEKEPSKENLEYFISSANGVKLFLNEPIKSLPRDNAKSIEIIREKGNRIGHALHVFRPTFKDLTFSKPIQEVFRALKFKKPIVCQSMYIFKSDYSTTTTACGHQIASYVHVEPPSALVGMWMAVDDNSKDNGCLEFIPGSHKQGLKTKFIRNPCLEEYNQGKRLIFTDEPIQEYEESEFVKVPIKEGSAILMNSLVVHKCNGCKSQQSRDFYAFNVYDSAVGKFLPENWMEYNDQTFLPLY